MDLGELAGGNFRANQQFGIGGLTAAGKRRISKCKLARDCSLLRSALGSRNSPCLLGAFAEIVAISNHGSNLVLLRNNFETSLGDLSRQLFRLPH